MTKCNHGTIGRVLFSLSEFNSAKTSFDQAVQIYNDLPDIDEEKAEVMVWVGQIEAMQGSIETSWHLLNECLTFYKKLDYSYAVGLVLHTLGLSTLWDSELAKARDFFQKSIEVRKEIGDEMGIMAVILTEKHN